MNDLKTSERSSLGKNLKNLMIWYTMAKDMPCSQVPVIDILHEYRSLAGILGRNAHRGQQPPQYNTRVKVEIDEE